MKHQGIKNIHYNLFAWFLEKLGIKDKRLKVLSYESTFIEKYR